MGSVGSSCGGDGELEDERWKFGLIPEFPTPTGNLATFYPYWKALFELKNGQQADQQPILQSESEWTTGPKISDVSFPSDLKLYHISKVRVISITKVMYAKSDYGIGSRLRIRYKRFKSIH
jgi:hypothetical protein